VRCEDCEFFDGDGYCDADPGRPTDRDATAPACRHYRPVNMGCENCRWAYTAERGELGRICAHGLHVWEVARLTEAEESAREVTGYDATHCCFWEGE